MRNSHENPPKISAALSVESQDDREIRSIRILLYLVVSGGVISVLVPRFSSQQVGVIGCAPQLLIGFVILVLVFYLQLASQRKLLHKVSTALIATAAYVERLEQFSFVDPETQLFNRRYLDQLFNQQLKWLNRLGKSATLLLIEVLPDGQKSEGPVVEASFVLRSNFRGSDWVVRNSTDQFLVLLPDTTEDQAEFALNRLADKVEAWNLENQKSEMSLRHEMNACPPGGDFWEILRGIEERLRHLRYKPGAPELTR